jgi:hypothetical protein
LRQEKEDAITWYAIASGVRHEPFLPTPVCGDHRLASAKDDKRMAHRGIRRKQNLALNTSIDYENLRLPRRLECAWNNTYS